MTEVRSQEFSSHQIGAEAVKALANMQIPPTPDNYQVWFSFLERSNKDLTSEIEEKIRSAADVDLFFLKDVHEKYFKHTQPVREVEKYTQDVLSETHSLQKIVTLFGQSAKSFSDDLENATQQPEDATQDLDTAEIVLSKLIEATQNAFSRNRQLENDLSHAAKKINHLQSSIKKIAVDASTDFLTGLFNRRYFDTTIELLLDNARIEDSPLSLVIGDIDHFKKFNDEWGHPVGDQVLKLVANVLQDNIKGQDLLARFGGEEFIIALPNTKLEDARHVANNLREEIQKRKLLNLVTNEEIGRVTMSFGVASNVTDETAQALYRRADVALYDAKQAGRNTVRCSGPVKIFT